MSPLGLYQPGSSPLHRTPPGWKLAGLLAVPVLIFLIGSPAWLAGITGCVAGAYAIGRIPPARCWQTMRLILPVVVIVFALQWWFLGLERAEVASLRLLSALGTANLFTLVTKVDDLVATVERAARPLRRFGVRPERLGLLVGLTLQAIAALSTIAADVREAQRARGAERSLPAFAVPFLVRTLRHADELGEALAARGIEDE